MNVSAALSTGNPNANPNNPLVRKRTETAMRESSALEKKTESAMNMDGSMNHFAFDNKPTIAPAARKPAQKKQASAFFSDSDEDDTPAYSQAYPTVPA